MSSWQEYADRSSLDTALAQHIAQCLRSDIQDRGLALLAVSGGSTPKAMFQQLSEIELPWERITITLVDERWVEPDSEDSNERLLQENLLQNRAASATLVGLKTPGVMASEGLPLARQLVDALPLPFSCTVLGMGGDGHTASWFPLADNLQTLLDPQNTQRLDISDPVTAPHQRITFTLSAILNSRELLVHITGEDKRQVLQQAGRRGYPIAAITSQTDTPATIWWAP
jgi:6-phosphogluconolactonase